MTHSTEEQMEKVIEAEVIFRGSYRGSRRGKSFRGNGRNGFDDSKDSKDDETGGRSGGYRGRGRFDGKSRPKSCFVCKSEMHLARDCPHKEEQAKNDEDEDVYYEEEIGIVEEDLEMFYGKWSK